ncbi:MAG: NAD-dependent epimerase/dehydratase family protein [Kiritimatiellae bacterium]|nr:NAD-dependent epimerase/dehydratase family protein [Kiritimatiellia bacterium]
MRKTQSDGSTQQQRMTVLVTGADGFVGRNLCAALEADASVGVLRFDIGNEPAELEGLAAQAAFVFHLAAVMRPPDPRAFSEINVDLTVKLLGLLRRNRLPPPVLLSSSIQAELDNPYGTSKRAAEAAVFGYGRETGAEVRVYRLPNLFGRWCRPNYSSAVATWCHNIARGLPIYVRDPAAELTLGYIDDVMREWLKALHGEPALTQDGFCILPTTYRRTLGQIADTLHRFKAASDAGQPTQPRDDFENKLLATFQTYL